jgi:DNA helicase-2/ATP-dependent DNA helicase PcrA
LYAASGEDQLSPFLTAAGVDVTLTRVAQVGRLLAADPTNWTAVEALSLLTFPREYGQERCFTHWWGAPPEVRCRVAGRLLALVHAVTEREAASRLGISATDVQLWSRFAPEPDPALARPFPDLDALCPPPRARRSRWAGVGPFRAQQAPPDYRVGELVRHPQFGQGLVVAVEAGTSRRQAEWYVTVEFRSRGLVKLLASLALLQRVG